MKTTSKIFGKRSEKVGLPPGTLIHVGEKKTEEVKITVIEYNEEHFDQRQLSAIEECFSYKNTKTITWINIDGIHNVENIQKLGDCFGLHPLVMEDILHTDQRPKMEDHDDYFYIVLKMLLNQKTPEFMTEQVSLILGPNFVISFQETEGDVFNHVRTRLATAKSRIRKMGADFLAYSLIDAIVDSYFIVLEKTGERLEDIEEDLMTEPSQKTLRAIHQMKREMIYLRKSVWPLREVISALNREDSPLIKDSTKIYLRDVYDHTIQVIDAIETFRDMLSGILDIYLSSLSNRMNEIMKFLTIIGTIFIPLTFVAGVYGMNFHFMPELRWHYGYFAVLAFMALVGIIMLIYFKWKKWL